MADAAIIGLGYMGKVVLEVLYGMPEVDVVAVADPEIDSLSKTIKEYGIERAVEDYSSLLGGDDIDVFHNCTPSHLHFDINKEIIQHDQNLITEKPLALSAEKAEELLALSKSSNSNVGLNFCYRYYPVIQEAAARVRNNEVGQPNVVMGSYLQDWLFHETDYSWRLKKGYAGESNAIADIGSHWCDLAQFVSGNEIIGVMADLETIIPVRKKSKDRVETFGGTESEELEDVEVDLEEYGSVLVKFDNGAKGSFTVGQVCAGRKCSIDLQVYGSEASLAWNHEDPNRLWVGYRDKANEEFIENPELQKEETKKYATLPAGHPLGYYEANRNLFSDLYKRFMNGSSSSNLPFPNIETGANEARIVGAIVESHRTESWVSV